uniref:BED-type domain-containing protein n=1 Tax=Daucus carota subsp. sativus TaxID=79200 RepID=A0A166FTI3_DAUCS
MESAEKDASPKKDSTPPTPAAEDPTPPTPAAEEGPEVNNSEAASNRKSWVWNHFKYVDNMTETSCPYCKKLIRCHVKKNGTRSLGNHLKNSCRTSPVYKGKHENKKQKTLESFQTCKSGSGNILEGLFEVKKQALLLSRSQEGKLGLCLGKRAEQTKWASEVEKQK